ncbi:MAG: MOSC domain-containing protein [Thiohalomonadaceae bacterium]
MQTIEALRATLPQAGRLEWIGLRPAPRAPVAMVQEARAVAGLGIEGDHHARRPGGPRQVTLVQAEHLPVIAALCGRASVHAEALRRNLVVSGINLLALVGRRFRIGEVLLEGVGPCPPCSRMERTLGPGGYNAVRGHGGITARVLRGGTLRIGDAVRPEEAGEET